MCKNIFSKISKKVLTYTYVYDIIKIQSRETETSKAASARKETNMENMTDKQFEKILKMVSMILDGCKDLDEAKEKVAELLEDQKKEKPAE